MHMISAQKRRDSISWTKETISSSRLPALRHNHTNDENTFNKGNLDNQQTCTATPIYNESLARNRCSLIYLQTKTHKQDNTAYTTMLGSCCYK